MLDDDENQEDLLKIQRVAGGSVIKYPPVFSPDNEIIFIAWENIVRAFSAITGEWIRDLIGANDRIISIHPDPNSEKYIIACSKSGEILSWKYMSGHLNPIIKLSFKTEVSIQTCNLLHSKNGELNAFITWYYKRPSRIVAFGFFDLLNGSRLPICLPINLGGQKALVDVCKNALGFLAITQGTHLYVANFQKELCKKWQSAKSETFTCVRCHPREEMVATGDVTGRIFLWRKLYRNGDPMTSLYHWHHTAVNVVTFTESGSSFYSGGNENVLVCWDIQHVDQRQYLPRMHGTPVHIVVSNGNQNISVSMNDNGIQILNPQLKTVSVIQNFTWIPSDKTGQNNFSCGLKINPRTTSLVMNGRIGHLQFYSTHTKSLLYNLDTTSQNHLSMELNKFLYSNRITHVSLNMDWMVTAELYDDMEHNREVRMKFWKFDTEKQCYTLNTHVETPHFNGLTALDFSSIHTIENLLCASAGKDNSVKIWSLEPLDNIYKKGKAWSCIGQLKYKNLPVRSLAFSADSSLLAIGFGRHLCIYKSDSLRLKCVLTAPGGLDGSTNKISITLPTKKTADEIDSTTAEKDYHEKRQAVLNLIKGLLDDQKDNSKCIKQLQDIKVVGTKSSSRLADIKLSPDEKKLLFEKIKGISELNLFQKLEIFKRFGIQYKTENSVKKKFIKYVQRNEIEKSIVGMKLDYRSYRLADEWRYSSIHQLYNFNRCNNQGKVTNVQNDQPIEDELLKVTTEIKHIAFGTGEYSNLIIIATENRLLIWNLLTLRLQSSFKLSVEHMVVDPYTNVAAIVSKDHELYIFETNMAIPIYQRANIPDIYGMAWIPRRYPKQHSAKVDWQATSQLYFLSKKQEIFHLVGDDDIDNQLNSTAHFNNTLESMSKTPLAAMIARKVNNAAVPIAFNPIGGQFTGTNTYIKEFLSLQSQSMAPMNLFCKHVLRSLLINAQCATDTKQKNDRSNNDDDYDNFNSEMIIDNDNDDNDENDATLSRRRDAMIIAERKKSKTTTGKADITDKQTNLRKLLKKPIKFEL